MADKFVHDQPLEPIDNGKRFFALNKSGPGRWLTIANVGVLWTNDSDSTHLRDITGPVDNERASFIAGWLVEMATAGMTAADAFDAVAYDHQSGTLVVAGDLGDLPRA